MTRTSRGGGSASGEGSPPRVRKNPRSLAARKCRWVDAHTYREALVAETGDEEGLLLVEHTLEHAEVTGLLLSGRRHLDDQRTALAGAVAGNDTGVESRDVAGGSERRAATPEVGRAEHAEVTDIMAAIVTVPRIDVSEATDVCTRLSLCRVFRTSTSQSYKSLFSRISSAGAFRGGRKSMNLTLHDR